MYINIKDIEHIHDFERQKKANKVHKQSDEYLRDSIKNVGMKEPLTVVKLGNRFLLIDGYRRLKAIEDLSRIEELHVSIDLTALPVVVHNKISPHIARYMTDIRQDIPYTMRAHFIKELKEKYGTTLKDIAHLYGKTAPSVENWLHILRTIPKVQKDIDSGRLPMTSAKVFATLKEEGQRRLYNRLQQYKKRVSRNTINREIRRIPKSMFNIPDKQKRKEMAKALIEKRTGYIHEDRTELKLRKKMVMDDIVVAVQELDYLERQIKSYYDTIRKYVNVADVWFRTTEIKKYIETNYSDKASKMKQIIYVELGKRI